MSDLKTPSVNLNLGQQAKVQYGQPNPNIGAGAGQMQAQAWGNLGDVADAIFRMKMARQKVQDQADAQSNINRLRLAYNDRMLQLRSKQGMDAIEDAKTLESDLQKIRAQHMKALEGKDENVYYAVNQAANNLDVETISRGEAYNMEQTVAYRNAELESSYKLSADDTLENYGTFNENSSIIRQREAFDAVAEARGIPKDSEQYQQMWSESLSDTHKQGIMHMINMERIGHARAKWIASKGAMTADDSNYIQERLNDAELRLSARNAAKGGAKMTIEEKLAAIKLKAQSFLDNKSWLELHQGKSAETLNQEAMLEATRYFQELERYNESENTFKAIGQNMLLDTLKQRLADGYGAVTDDNGKPLAVNTGSTLETIFSPTEIEQGVTAFGSLDKFRSIVDDHIKAGNMGNSGEYARIMLDPQQFFAKAAAYVNINDRDAMENKLRSMMYSYYPPMNQRQIDTVLAKYRGDGVTNIFNDQNVASFLGEQFDLDKKDNEDAYILGELMDGLYSAAAQEGRTNMSAPEAIAFISIRYDAVTNLIRKAKEQFETFEDRGSIGGLFKSYGKSEANQAVADLTARGIFLPSSVRLVEELERSKE